jgi:thymidine phosphorylase
MVELGTEHGLVTRALLTDMNRPLGRTVGNAVEVDESLEVLAGGGPSDVVELTLALAGEMLDAAGLDGVDPANTLRDGSAMDHFGDWSALKAATYRNRCSSVRSPRPSPPPAVARWAISTQWRWD